MQVEMKCVSSPHYKEMFSLAINGKDVELRSSSASTLLETRLGTFGQIVEFPSFVASNKWFGIPVGDKMLEFKLPKRDLKAIRSAIDDFVISTLPDNLSRFKRQALLKCLGGAILVVLSFGVSIASYLFADRNEGRFTVFFGLSIFGLWLFGSNLSTYVRMKNAQERSGGPRF